MQRRPLVDEVRPGRCPFCETPSRRPGRPMALWGHGRRARQLEGPLAPEAAPTAGEAAGRRYRCQVCGAVILVVPREVLPWRRYTGAAIAWALALWGHRRRKVSEVRRRTSTTGAGGFGDPDRWAALRRWVKAAQDGRLFAAAGARRVTSGGTMREIAGRLAVLLAAHAPPTVRGQPLEVQAFQGGATMA